jgi:hypothetical protein
MFVPGFDGIDEIVPQDCFYICDAIDFAAGAMHHDAP